jgi:hypothetical protein
MSLLPKRSLRLTGQPTDYYQRFTGSSGEIYYDKTLETLRVFPGNVSVGKVVAAFDLGGRLPLGSGAGAIYANQTTGSITIGDYIGTSGQPQAPSTVVQIGGATNAFAISAYGPPSVGWQFDRNGALTLPGDIKSNGNINIEINLADSTLQKWQFGEDGALTFPDGTSQTTAYTGGTVFTNLIDSADSSAITVTPAVIFSSDVTVENDLVAKNINNNGQRWTFGQDGTTGFPNSTVLTATSLSITTNHIATDQTWVFNTAGSLTLPGGATLKDANYAVALGLNAGNTSQGFTAVAIGTSAGAGSQGSGAVALGYIAGLSQQGANAIAIGNQAGNISQGANAIAIGSYPADSAQGTNAIAIGYTAGYISQGANAIAIGKSAGVENQGANSIIINATGATLDQTTANTFTVAPIRNAGGTSGLLQYNSTTKEVTYSSDITSNSNINIEINLADSTRRVWQFGEDGALTFPDGTNQTTAFTGIPGPYADDEAAALAGVALGSPYHKTGTNGQVFVRLTSPT